jgi:hypothetical protein
MGNLRTKILGTVLLIITISSCLCSPGRTTKKAPPVRTISVQYEKLMILPITGYETLRRIPRWPKDSATGASLDTLLEICTGELTAEFRRC